MTPAIVIMVAAAVSLLALLLDPAWTKSNERFPEDSLFKQGSHSIHG